MNTELSILSDEQITAIAKSLGWKTTDPKKAFRAISLNYKSEKVRSAIYAELIRELEIVKAEDTGDHRPTQSKNEPNDTPFITRDFDSSGKATDTVSFGMNDKQAAQYLSEKFGLVPRMAKRAVNRGIDGWRGKDEYHGKGYVVKVVDTSDTEYDIQVFAA